MRYTNKVQWQTSFFIFISFIYTHRRQPFFICALCYIQISKTFRSNMMLILHRCRVHSMSIADKTSLTLDLSEKLVMVWVNHKELWQKWLREWILFSNKSWVLLSTVLYFFTISDKKKNCLSSSVISFIVLENATQKQNLTDINRCISQES